MSEDLNLPSIRYSLPHVTKSPKSLNLAFKWSKGTVFENHSNKSNVNFFLDILGRKSRLEPPNSNFANVGVFSA